MAELQPVEEDVSTADRLLDVATVAFARKGYHGTSIRDLAREVNLSIATLYYYVQNKDDLYIKVFQRQYEEESKLVEDILASADETTSHNPAALRELLYKLMDSLIDRAAANPDIVRLWTLRWLEKPTQTEDIESEYFIPLYEKVENLLGQAQAAGVIHPGISNVDFVSHGFTWLHYGYFGMGQLTFRPNIGNPLQPEQVEEFRAFMHTFIDRMLRFSDQDRE